jgi:hypothetical protein
MGGGGNYKGKVILVYFRSDVGGTEKMADISNINLTLICT